MKKLLVLFLLLTVASVPTAFAQSEADTPPPGRERGQRGGERGGDPAARIAEQVAELTKGLKLTPEQATDVTAIMTATTEKMRALRKNAEGDRAGMRDQLRQLFGEQDKQIEALLTKKQLRKYENVKAARRQGGPRGGGRPGGGRPDGGNR